MSVTYVTRRRALQIAGAAAVSASPFGRTLLAQSSAGSSASGPGRRGPQPPDLNVSTVGPDLAKAQASVLPEINWSAVELDEFLRELPPEALLSLKKALELVDSKASVAALKGGEEDIHEIQTQLLWVSSHILAYPFRDEKKIAYHDLVKWVADDAGVEQWILDTQPTFVIERAYQERLFVSIWDTLDPQKRQILLLKLEQSRPRGAQNVEIADKAAIAALSGSGALAALATTVYFSSFTFYTTMSVVICTVAGWFGVTLPFAAYTAASSAIAFLCGPVGWAMLAIAAAAGVALAGRANTKRTGAAICQLHALKVAALQQAGRLPQDVVGDPIKRQLVGKWRYRTTGRTIEFELKYDGSLTCEDQPDSKPSWREGHGFIHSGKGIWKVHGDVLTMAMTHVWVHAVWWKHEVTWIDRDKITKITSTEVLLADGDRLKRQ